MNIEEKVIAALWSLMGRRDFLQGKGLVGRVAEKAGIDPLEAKMTLGKLARKGIIEGVSVHGEAFGRVSLTIEAPKREEAVSLVRWREALRKTGLDDREVEMLAPCHDRLDGFSDADRLVPLIRKGNPPSPKVLLGHSKILFWGDLDKEGLRIYTSLRKGLPALRASALYLPMLEAMERGVSHP